MFAFTASAAGIITTASLSLGGSTTISSVSPRRFHRGPLFVEYRKRSTMIVGRQPPFAGFIRSANEASTTAPKNDHPMLLSSSRINRLSCFLAPAGVSPLRQALRSTTLRDPGGVEGLEFMNVPPTQEL